MQGHGKFTPAPIFNPRKRPRQAVIADPQLERSAPGPSGAATSAFSDLMPPGGFGNGRQQQPQQQQYQHKHISSVAGRGATKINRRNGPPNMNAGGGQYNNNNNNNNINNNNSSNSYQQINRSTISNFQNYGKSNINSIQIGTSGNYGNRNFSRFQASYQDTALGADNVLVGGIGRNQQNNGPSGQLHGNAKSSHADFRQNNTNALNNQFNHNKIISTGANNMILNNGSTAQQGFQGGSRGCNNNVNRASGNNTGSKYSFNSGPSSNRNNFIINNNNNTNRQMRTQPGSRGPSSNEVNAFYQKGGGQPYGVTVPNTIPGINIPSGDATNINEWDGPMDNTAAHVVEKPPQVQKVEDKKHSAVLDLQKSMHVFTMPVSGIRRWSKFKDSVQMMFEVFGYLDSATTRGSGGKEFLLRDDTKEGIKCVFYEIDRQLPKMTRGQWYRVVGTYDPKKDQMKCISVRMMAGDERSLVQSLVRESTQSVSQLTRRLREQ